MQLSYNTILVALLGLDCVLAQPANRQRQRRDLADVNWSDASNYEGVDWKTVNYGNGAATSTPVAAASTPVAATSSPVAAASTTTPLVAATTTSAAQSVYTPKKGTPIHHHHNNHSPVPKATNVAASSAASSAVSSTSGSKSFGGVTSPKDNGNKDEYIGNVGIPYGSNMILLDSADKAAGFKYSNTFTNPTADKISVIVWNKSGKDGQAQSGMGLPPTLTFSLGPNESKAVAFDENSQVAFAQDCARDPMKGNLPNCTWGEVDFGDLRNGGWSGYDRSSIPNSAGNTGLLTISCKGAKTSSEGSNSFTSAAQTNAGGSVVPGPAHFFTSMGA